MDDGLSTNGYVSALVASLAQPLLVLDRELTVELASGAFLRHFELTREETEGRPFQELGGGAWQAPEIAQLLEELLRSGRRIEELRVERSFPRLGTRIVLISADRFRHGGLDRIVLSIADVTERERLLFEIEGQKEFSEKLIDSVREALLILHWDLNVHSANKSFYDRFQVSPDEIVGRRIYDIQDGAWDIPGLRQLLEEILPEKTTFDDFEVAQDFNGVGRRIMLLNGRRLDHLNLIVLAIRDVTEQRRHELQQKAFMGELHHRVKNILNNVRALAAQLRYGNRTLEEFHEAFETRLGALARAQDLFVKAPDDAILLRQLLHLELSAIGAEEGRCFNARGPEISLSPRQAQAIAMPLHELATNAAKHGALAREAGRIEIRWQITERDGEPYLEFHWREEGVTIEVLDPPRGFGTRVILDSLPYMLDGDAELTFHHDGAECRFGFPLNNGSDKASHQEAARRPQPGRVKEDRPEPS